MLKIVIFGFQGRKDQFIFDFKKCQRLYNHNCVNNLGPFAKCLKLCRFCPTNLSHDLAWHFGLNARFFSNTVWYAIKDVWQVQHWDMNPKFLAYLPKQIPSIQKETVFTNILLVASLPKWTKFHWNYFGADLVLLCCKQLCYSLQFLLEISVIENGTVSLILN